MQPSFVKKFVAFFSLLIDERASAASIFPWTATNGQFEDITTATYANDVTQTPDLADVTDFFTALGEVTDYTTTSSAHISSFTPSEAPDVAGLASMIDASSAVVTSTTDSTTPSKYSSLSTPQLAATGELISSAEIRHLNGRMETTIQSTSIKTAPTASIWSPSLSSDGNPVCMLNANTSVGATSGPATLLSAEAIDFTISVPTASSTGTKNIAVTTQATAWQGTYKNSFTSSTPATLSGGSQSVANISVPAILSVSTERVAAISIQTNSSETTESAFPLIPSTSPGVTSNISIFSIPLSAATKGFFTSLRLTTSSGTTNSAFFLPTPSASLKATSNAATFATPVSSSSWTIILGNFLSEATPPTNSNYATTVSAPPTCSGTAKNIFTLSKPATSLGTTAKVFHVSTPAISRRASMHNFSLSQIICSLVMSRTFVYYVS